MLLTDTLLAAAEYAGKKLYTTPYTNARKSFLRANFYYTCADGTIIHRPNHSIAEVLRTIAYLEPVVSYYKINAIEEIKVHLQALSALEMEKIKFLLLFFTSGRENEVGYNDDPDLYKRFREQAKNNLIRYFSQQKHTYPFQDTDEIKRYASLLQCYELSDLAPSDKVIVLLLRSCHTLNLLRCYPHKAFKKNIDKTFNAYSSYKDTRNLQSLIYYAQNCTLATGDKLRTKYQIQNIIGVHIQQGLTLQLIPSRLSPTVTGNNSIVFAAKGYDEALFAASCKAGAEDIKRTVKRLKQVPKPHFYRRIESVEQYSAMRALRLIEAGNGVVRVINGNPKSFSLRLEIEQLTNPKFVRPLRKKKLNIDHTYYYDLATHKTVRREEKAYIDITSQSPKDKPQPAIEYKSDKPISKQEDRGKPKNTIFTKKQSYSLLPSNGLFPLFKGRLYDRATLNYTPVGMLYNLERMEPKGERYIWQSDIRTSGLGGYFWLPETDAHKPSSSFLPSLNNKRYKGRCNLQDLKSWLQKHQDAPKFNEMLMGASLKTLEAIFAVKDARQYRLAALHTQTVLNLDYGVIRPLLIIDGKTAPKEYTASQIKEDLAHSVTKYRKWYWRLLHFFIGPTKEYEQVLNIIKFFSAKGIVANINELNNKLAPAGDPISSTQAVYHSLSSTNGTPFAASPTLVPCEDPALQSDSSTHSQLIPDIGPIHRPIPGVLMQALASGHVPYRCP